MDRDCRQNRQSSGVAGRSVGGSGRRENKRDERLKEGDPLWRIIGLGRAKEVALTGRIYDAHEAEKMGYVSRVFPEGKLLESVGTIAREMATYDRGCLKETKQLSHKVLNEDLDGAMRLQEWLIRSYIGSDDNHQRIDALQAKLGAARKK